MTDRSIYLNNDYGIGTKLLNNIAKALRTFAKTKLHTVIIMKY